MSGLELYHTLMNEELAGSMFSSKQYAVIPLDSTFHFDILWFPCVVKRFWRRFSSAVRQGNVDLYQAVNIHTETARLEVV